MHIRTLFLAAHQYPLADLGHGTGELCQVITPVRPVAGLSEIGAFAAIHAEIGKCILRRHKLFTAFCAVITVRILRSTNGWARSAHHLPP